MYYRSSGMLLRKSTTLVKGGGAVVFKKIKHTRQHKLLVMASFLAYLRYCKCTITACYLYGSVQAGMRYITFLLERREISAVKYIVYPEWRICKSAATKNRARLQHRKKLSVIY